MKAGTKLAWLVMAGALVAGAYFVVWPRFAVPASPVNSARPNASSALPAPTSDQVVDPLAPGHPAVVDATARPAVGDWVSARPGFQHSRSAVQRGGIEPCAAPSVDTSAFDGWTPLARGHFVAPRELQLDASGHFDLVIHLLGDELARRELVESKQPFVLYAITLDTSQSYATLFTGSYLFHAIVAEIEQDLSKRLGRPAHLGHLAFSAWSAGFTGIEAAISQDFRNQIDGVILIDGLHAPRNDKLAFQAQLKPFLDYAALASKGQRFMFIDHSSIDPPDFASTTECAHYLIAQLGGKPQPVKRQDPFGLELVEYFCRGDFNVRGYAGNDKADHCAQLASLRMAYAALGRRWHPALGASGL